MNFVTAAVGERYHRHVRGLIRSLARSTQNAKLYIYTDQPPHDTSWTTEIGFSFSDRSKLNPDRIDLCRLKLECLSRTASRTGWPLIWTDADMLILDDVLAPIVLECGADGIFDAVGLTRRTITDHSTRRKIDCGNGLIVNEESYFLSGFFLCSLPVFGRMAAAWLSRPHWENPGRGDAESEDTLGCLDQPILNHALVIRDTACISLRQDRIVNLDLCDGEHPYPEHLSKVAFSLRGDDLYAGSRKVAIFYWTAQSLEANLSEDFAAIRDDASRAFIRSFYADE